MEITLIICASIMLAVVIAAFTLLVLFTKDKIKPEDYEDKLSNLKVELAIEIAGHEASKKATEQKVTYLNARIKELTEKNLALVTHNTTLNSLNKELENNQTKVVAKRKAK